MGRRPQPARLWLRRKPKPGRWLVLDNVGGERIQHDTHCSAEDVAGAEAEFREYINKRDIDRDEKARALAAREALRQTRQPHEVTFAELALYADALKAPAMARPREYSSRWEILLDYVEDDTLDAVLDPAWLSGFVAHVGSAASARRILEDVRAVAREWVAKRTLVFVPPIPMPDKSEPRPDYLTYEEVKALVRTAWWELDSQERLTGRKPKVEGDAPQVLREVGTSRRRWRHLVPYILVSVLTCTRASRVYEASYDFEEGRPWINLRAQKYHRLADGEKESRNKKAPAVPIPDRLARSMRRWSGGEPTRDRRDGHLRFGRKYLVQYSGRPADCRKSFAACVERARERYPDLFKRDTGKPKQIVRHTLRHTGVTLLAQWGVPSDDICEYAGMSAEVFERIYRHSDPEHMSRVMDAMGGRKSKPKSKATKAQEH